MADEEQEIEKIAEEPVEAAKDVIEDAIETIEEAPGAVADATAAALTALELRVTELERSRSAPAESHDDADEADEAHDDDGEGVPIVVLEEATPNSATTHDSFFRKIHDVLG